VRSAQILYSNHAIGAYRHTDGTPVDRVEAEIEQEVSAEVLHGVCDLIESDPALMQEIATGDRPRFCVLMTRLHLLQLGLDSTPMGY
jgi:hypothetical protein